MPLVPKEPKRKEEKREEDADEAARLHQQQLEEQAQERQRQQQQQQELQGQTEPTDVDPDSIQVVDPPPATLFPTVVVTPRPTTTATTTTTTTPTTTTATKPPIPPPTLPSTPSSTTTMTTNAPDLKLKLPEFNNKTHSRAEAANYIELVDRYQLANKLNDEQAASCVRFTLGGTALTWYNNEKRLKTPGIDTWNAPSGGDPEHCLKHYFKKEFCPDHTPAELASLRSAMSQRAKETVSEWYNRATEYHIMSMNKFPPPDYSDPKRQDWQEMFNNSLLSIFYLGLKPEIRNAFSARSGLDIITLAAHKDAALTAERDLREQKARQHGHDVPVDKIEVDVEAIKRFPTRSFNQNQTSRGRGSYRGKNYIPNFVHPRSPAYQQLTESQKQAQQQKYYGKQNRPTNANQDKPPGKCHNCGSADHWIRQCDRPRNKNLWMVKTKGGINAVDGEHIDPPYPSVQVGDDITDSNVPEDIDEDGVNTVDLAEHFAAGFANFQ